MAYKVLLADDSITIQKVVELILSEEDAEIISVSDGAMAMESLERVRPDVVLADIEMPKISGYEISEQIRQSPGTRDIPVILMAGAFESFDEARARNAGATDYIIKPFDSADLLEKIDAARAGRIALGASSEPATGPESAVEPPPEAETRAPEPADAGTEEPFRVSAPEVEESALEPETTAFFGLDTEGTVSDADRGGESLIGPGLDFDRADETRATDTRATDTESTAEEPEPGKEAPQQDLEGVVSSSDEFDDEDFWEAEEIEISDVLDREEPAEEKARADVVRPATQPEPEAPFAEDDELTEPSDEPENAVEVSAETPVDPEAKTVLAETAEPPSEEPLETAADETPGGATEPPMESEPADPGDDHLPGDEEEILDRFDAGDEEETPEESETDAASFEVVRDEASLPEETPSPETEKETSLRKVPSDENGTEKTGPETGDSEELSSEPEKMEPAMEPVNEPVPLAAAVPSTIAPPDPEQIASALRDAVGQTLPDRNAVERLLIQEIGARLGETGDLSTRIEKQARETLAEAVPSSESIEKILRDSLDAPTLQQQVRDSALETLRTEIGEGIGKQMGEILWEILPDALERKLDQILRDAVLPAIQDEINAAARRIVPEIAEKLIQGEIEKFRAES